MDAENVPIPSLLATGAVHHHLLGELTRTRVGLVVETGGSAGDDALCLAHRLRRRRHLSVPGL